MKRKFSLFSIMLIMLFGCCLFSACNNSNNSTSVYTIIFDTNGGTECNSIEYELGKDLKMPDDPTKEDYIFDGWYSDNGVWQEEFTINTILNYPLSKGSEITIYAKWLKKQYTINFESNGGTVVNPITQEFGSIVIKPNNPIYEEHSFMGWFDITLTNEYQFTTMPNENITLYAKWKPIIRTTYIVNHYLENVENDEYTLFENEEKNGIVDEIVTPNVNYYNGFTSPTQQNLEIKTSNNVVNYYYKRNSYNLTIVTNSEIGEKQIYVKYNTNLESINQVSKESYSFGGYFTNENLTNQITHMPAYDTKVYVWWQEETKPTAFNYDKEYTSIVISGYIGNDSNVNVPSYIGGLPVNRILSLYSSKIINLTLPDTLTYVGSLNGERPHIPDYDYYGNFPLFSECNIYIKNLETITNLTIGDNVGSGFKGCKLYINNELLTELTISRTNILFYGYNYLKKVTISNAINITASAFMECKELTDVIINGNIETISNSAFSYCSKLTNVIINGYVKETDSFSFMKTALYNVPNGIQKIGTYAFSECENLTNIVLPNSITTIDDYAFADCSNLTSITIPNSVNDMGETIFKNCTNLNFVSVPFVGESRTDTEGRFYKLFERKWSANLQTYYYLIPDSLSKVAVTDAVIIPDNAFSIIYCNIDTVILNEGIESIGESAFSCVGNGLNFGIKNVVIPQSVKNIEPWCFSHSETSVFYCGTKTQWEELEALSSVVYFYTETLIENENKYWHYVNDEITIWE